MISWLALHTLAQKDIGSTVTNTVALPVFLSVFDTIYLSLNASQFSHKKGQLSSNTIQPEIKWWIHHHTSQHFLISHIVPTKKWLNWSSDTSSNHRMSYSRNGAEPNEWSGSTNSYERLSAAIIRRPWKWQGTLRAVEQVFIYWLGKDGLLLRGEMIRMRWWPYGNATAEGRRAASSRVQ